MVVAWESIEWQQINEGGKKSGVLKGDEDLLRFNLQKPMDKNRHSDGLHKCIEDQMLGYHLSFWKVRCHHGKGENSKLAVMTPLLLRQNKALT